MQILKCVNLKKTLKGARSRMQILQFANLRKTAKSAYLRMQILKRADLRKTFKDADSKMQIQGCIFSSAQQMNARSADDVSSSDRYTTE